MSNMRGAAQESPTGGGRDVEADPLRYEWRGVFGPDDICEVPAIVSRWLPDGIRMLDVGCGSGAITLLVSHGKNNTIVGVEPDPIRSELARSRGLNVITGLMDAAFLEKYGPFDVVMFTDVLEHMINPDEVISMAVKGIRPGGFIIASVPNVAHWTVRVRLLLGRFNYTEVGIMDKTHLRWFTRKSFRELFEHNGLEVCEMSASAGYWLSEYHRLPIRILPGRLRRKLVQSLTKIFPGLFGCQHVVKAQCR